MTSRAVDCRAKANGRDHPQIGKGLGCRNCPAWVAERQIYRPEQLARVKPNRPACHKNTIHYSHREKLALRALMVSFPPHRQQPHAYAEKDKWNDLRELLPVDWSVFQP